MIDPTLASKKGFIYELGTTGLHTRRMGTLPGVVELHLNMIRHHNDFLRDMSLRNTLIKTKSNA